MPRHASMADQLAKLKRRYRHVSPQRFFYNKPGELRKRVKEILVWFLIHDDTRGHSIFAPRFRVAQALTVKEWAFRFTNPLVRFEKTPLLPLVDTLAKNILPAINAKGGKDWKFKAVIGWTGYNEPKKSQGSRVSAKNKPAKKRNRA